MASCAAQQGNASSGTFEEDYVGGDADFRAVPSMKLEDAVYRDDIRTVQLYPSGNPLDMPIITMGTEQQLELHFDDMGTDIDQYFYELIHCTATWEESELNQMQYLEGFFHDILTDFQTSFTTGPSYVHHTLRVPNQNMRPTLSGNYILHIYTDEAEPFPVITRRFMIVKPRVSIAPRVRQSTEVAIRRAVQLVDFEVQHPSYPIDNPFRDVKAVVLQNRNWETAKFDLEPVFLRNQSLEYRYESGNEFWGGNEFRRFNLNNLFSETVEVEKVSRDSTGQFYATLVGDLKRNLRGYRTLRDANGQFLIQNLLGRNNEVEAEYVETTFRLRWTDSFATPDLYIYGGLSDWDIDERFKMSYDAELKEYRAQILLKQGYYEYEYVASSDGTLSTLDRTLTEGSFFETENDYSILIYHRDIGLGHDALIGVRNFSTESVF